MKTKISYALFISLFLISCGDSPSNQTEAVDIPQDTLESGQDIEQEVIDTTEKGPSLSVIDYYYLLPSIPYFETEMGEDSKDSRKKGIVYNNENNGYVKGGLYMGPNFTMALFRNREANIDYIMAQRLPYPGSMFEDFFDFITYKDGEWTSAMDLFKQADTDRDEHFSPNLGEEEIISPIIPEKGTTLEFHKWDPFYGEGMDNSVLQYSYAWNGERFEFVKN